MVIQSCGKNSQEDLFRGAAEIHRGDGELDQRYIKEDSEKLHIWNIFMVRADRTY